MQSFLLLDGSLSSYHERPGAIDMAIYPSRLAAFDCAVIESTVRSPYYHYYSNTPGYTSPTNSIISCIGFWDCSCISHKQVTDMQCWNLTETCSISRRGVSVTLRHFDDLMQISRTCCCFQYIELPYDSRSLRRG